YPPVMCLATNWETESCESRQAPLPRPNPLRAFGRAVERPKTVLYSEQGGSVVEHWQRWLKLAGSGNDVEIRGACVSACTLIMAHISSDMLCLGESASLQFHPARDPNTGEPSEKCTQWMLNQYPQDIRLWIKNKGGWEKMALHQFWTLDATELWRMGYRKCEPEEAPVPMTKPVKTYDPSAQYRPIWK